MSVEISSRVATFIRRYLTITASVSVVIDVHNIHARLRGLPAEVYFHTAQARSIGPYTSVISSRSVGVLVRRDCM